MEGIGTGLVPITPPSFGVTIGAGRIPEDPDPNEPTVEGIGTGRVVLPNCLGEMFDIVTSVPC